MTKKFKVGDRVLDLACPDYGTGIVQIVEADNYYINFNNRNNHHDKIRGLTRRQYDDRDLIHEDVYNSPLYKALS